ncbi:MAG: GHKL domain-containing protein [Lachnospiraceae bacterium]|nr:GHKL domain-containing protein [Lachnospiraceae bacterium]
MRLVIRSIILSFMMGISCQAFYETIVPRRKLWYGWIEHTTVLAFTAGFMVIAVTPIPPYIFQPVRVIIVAVIVAQIYFQMGIVKNLVLSVMLCGIYWLFSVLFISVAGVALANNYIQMDNLMEPIVDIGYLCLMLAFRYRYQNRVRGFTDIKWGKFGLFSLVGIVVSIAVAMMSQAGSMADYYARLTAIAGFAVVYVLGFYYMVRLLERESQMQKLRLLQEQTQNQMNLYQNMKKRYEQQRRFSHDYKNQLHCIQGMIGSGQTKEALEYIAELTGNFRQSEMCVNTEHAVVNVMLSQKYREASDKGIVMTMVSGDLSGLTISEEDIVTLLGNLFDNAIEACEKLDVNKVIQFKMVQEEGQLVLSIRNPVKEQVRIKDNRIVTSKRDKSQHGIGLMNVESVVRKNNGTSVLKCEDGWFTFAAMIPMEQK